MAETRNNLTKKQKLALTGLTVFAICLVGVWFLKLDSEINGPIKWQFSPIDSVSTTSPIVEDKTKIQDTDGDGLYDWDELNVFFTSPYLADSDSDGFSDGEEVRNGANPNCPAGKSCNGSKVSNTAVSSPKIASSSQAGLENLLSITSDPANLRKILLEAGIEKKELDKLTDEQLVKAYQEALASSTNANKKQ